MDLSATHPLEIETESRLIKHTDTPKDLMVDLTIQQELAIKKKNQAKSIVYSLIASFFVAIFYIAMQYVITKENSIGYAYTNCFGLLFYSLIYHSYSSYKKWSQSGQIWSKDNSIFYKKDGSFTPKTLIFIIMRGSIGSFNYLVYSIIMNKCNQAHVSVSVVYSLLSLNSFSSAMLFYFVFKEKLKIKHFIGMGLIFLAVVLIGISKNKQPEDSDEPSISIIVPLMWLLLSIITFTTLLLLTRLVLNTGMSQYEFTADFLIPMGLIQLGLTLNYHFKIQPYNWIDVFIFNIGSIFQILTLFLVNLATKLGKVGISQSIMQLSCISQMIFEMIFYAHYPTLLQIIAVLLAILGASIISIGN